MLLIVKAHSSQRLQLESCGCRSFICGAQTVGDLACAAPGALLLVGVVAQSKRVHTSRKKWFDFSNQSDGDCHAWQAAGRRPVVHL